MPRSRKHNVKIEDPEPSTSRKIHQEHDLAYYIHDRVELMHQVFSVLKQKEIKAMAPECVKNVTIDDLQELCTEELLGISSKRLLAVLDGAEPPSDTESSSRSPSPQLETISLDSISSDDEVLNDDQRKKKKHKHHRRSLKSKSKDRKKKKAKKDDEAEQSTASRAGLTVLELLELQARARAIRAQLQQERDTAEPASTAQEVSNSDNEVEIKEEPLEVLVISSEDEEKKPNVQELQKKIKNKEPEKVTQSTNESPNKSSHTTTPPVQESTQTLTKRCNDLIVTVPQTIQTRKIKLKRTKVTIPDQSDSTINKTDNIVITTTTSTANVSKDSHPVAEKRKKKKKKREKQFYNIDNDEITLQLSDSEKMDLLQDLEKKQDIEVESGTESDSSEDTNKESKSDNAVDSITIDVDVLSSKNETIKGSHDKGDTSQKKEITTVEEGEINGDSTDNEIQKEMTIVEEGEIIDGKDSETTSTAKKINCTVTPITLDDPDVIVLKDDDTNMEHSDVLPAYEDSVTKKDIIDDKHEEGEITSQYSEDTNITDKNKDTNIVYINKDTNTAVINEDTNIAIIKEDADIEVVNEDENMKTCEEIIEETVCISDDETNDVIQIIDEIELSDDDSCSEISILSKEPTAEEIAALSAKIDEMEQDDDNASDHLSWKERYVESSKVKKVLTVANIFNALRKKNIELKKSMHEMEKSSETADVPEVPVEDKLEEGTIEQYNTLESSGKYNGEAFGNVTVTADMKKDAKVLLKMYKKLLKYNNIMRVSKKKKDKKKNRENPET